LHAPLIEPTVVDIPVRQPAVPMYAWVVFALTVGLLFSDYMSRQVLNAVFPLLKSAWGMSDTQLGSLSSVVALMVGLLTFPLSVLADRWGRIRSIVLMATLWSLATLGCAISTRYGEMLVARALVGLGEAAYGSVGIAVVLSIFPARLRSTLSGIFAAGAAFGSVLGLALGGVFSAHFGWRWSFAAMGCFGIVLVITYRIVVTGKRLTPLLPPGLRDVSGKPGIRISFRTLMAGLFSSTSVRCAYVGSGLQLLVPAALWAWMPSFLNRYYALAPGKAALCAAGFVLITGLGMSVCGMVTDRVSASNPTRKWASAIVYCLASFMLLVVAFWLPNGPLQLMLIGAGMFFGAGSSGPAGAMVANLTPPQIHGSAFATLTLANNLLGLAPAAIITGAIADRIGLFGALNVILVAPLIAAIVFVFGWRNYTKDLSRLTALREQAVR
jgi:MFS family permease